MQRLFSTFPGGKPGAALLLLRAPLAGTLLDLSSRYFGDTARGGGLPWAFGLLAAASGACVLFGFLTPFAVVAGLLSVGVAVARPPPSAPVLTNGALAAILVVIAATSLILLGPGALSVDARLFGRREIRVTPGREDAPED